MTLRVIAAAPIAAILLCALSSCGPKPIRNGAAPAAGAAPSAADRPDESGIVLVSAHVSVGPRPAPATAAKDRLSANERRLAPLFAALEGLETGAGNRPVTILQIGDSHTAGDFLSGEMRKLFQARFGAAGRGFVPPGLPDKYYRPDLIDVDETKGWERIRSADRSAEGRFGIAGLAQKAKEPRQRMIMTSTEDAGFDHGFVEILDGGTFRLSVDDAPARIFTIRQGGADGDWIEFDAPPHSHQLKIETTDESWVTLLSWGVQRQGPGVLYDNLGTIGATAQLIERWDPAIVASELRHLDPAMIIIAFGTNEAFGNDADLAEFRDDFIARVDMLAKAAPGAAILIIGPPDVNRRYRRPAGVTGECTVRAPGGAPLASTTAPATARKGRGVRGAIWAPPPELTVVRADERSAADSQGWYFWDWSVAMGGPCSAHRWSALAEPLARPDHVHQTIAGYQLTAQRLFDELMTGYDHYRHPSGGRPNGVRR